MSLGAGLEFPVFSFSFMLMVQDVSSQVSVPAAMSVTCHGSVSPSRTLSYPIGTIGQNQLSLPSVALAKVFPHRNRKLIQEPCTLLLGRCFVDVIRRPSDHPPLHGWALSPQQ